MGHREKLMREGLLVEKQRKRDQIEIRIDRCVKAINYESFPSDGIKSINPDKVLQAAEDLKDLMGEWEVLGDEIKKLKEEV